MLKPQDVLIVLKLVSKGDSDWSQGSLAHELAMSSAEVNAGLKRLRQCNLLDAHEDGRRYRPNKQSLIEFLVHGIRYVFPPIQGAPAVGVPTSIAAHPLKSHMDKVANVLPVWPSEIGKTKGFSFQPLYRSAAKACRSDKRLYELLVIVDALRDASFESPELARVMLADRFGLSLSKNLSPAAQAGLLDDEQLDLL